MSFAAKEGREGDHLQVGTTTPLWVTLLVAGMGLLASVGGTVSGALLTTRNAIRREETPVGARAGAGESALVERG